MPIRPPIRSFGRRWSGWSGSQRSHYGWLHNCGYLPRRSRPRSGRRGFIATGETKVIDNPCIGIHAAARRRCSQLGLPTGGRRQRGINDQELFCRPLETAEPRVPTVRQSGAGVGFVSKEQWPPELRTPSACSPVRVQGWAPQRLSRPPIGDQMPGASGHRTRGIYASARVPVE